MKKTKHITDDIILKEFIYQFARNKEIRKIPKAISYAMIPKKVKLINLRVTPADLNKSLDNFSNKFILPCVTKMIKAIGNEGDVLMFGNLKMPNGMDGAIVNFEDISVRILSSENIDPQMVRYIFKRIDIAYSWCNLLDIQGS